MSDEMMCEILPTNFSTDVDPLGRERGKGRKGEEGEKGK